MIQALIYSLFYYISNVYSNRTKGTRITCIEGTRTREEISCKCSSIPEEYCECEIIRRDGFNSEKFCSATCQPSAYTTPRNQKKDRKKVEVTTRELGLLSLLLFFIMYTVYYHTIGFAFMRYE